MKIRFEVAVRKSYYWPFFVKAAKKHGAFKIGRGKAPMCSVEVKNTVAAMAIWRIIRSWKYVEVAVEGMVVSNSTFNRTMWKLEFEKERTQEMLRGVIERHAKKRDRGDDEGRWRMGMGPDPSEG